MSERRSHWDDDLIDAVRNAPPKRTLNDAQTYAVIAAVEDWQDRTQQARAMSMTDNEAAIARVRKWHAEHCDECNDTGPCPTIRALDEEQDNPCRDGKHSSCVGGPCECPCHELAAS